MTDIDLVKKTIPADVAEKLGERYVDLVYVSKGATSAVFKAKDQHLNKQVAIKVLFNTQERELIKFQAEAKAASKLKHHNLLTAMDFDITRSNRAYIIMDFVSGESLEEHLRQQGRLTLKAALSVAIQIADGMSHSHSLGICHRDLKTSNIMLDNADTGDLKVTVVDFGLARGRTRDQAENQEESGGKPVGSPLYMSPEQTRGEQADERSDIYSLGCIIFKMLTGNPPFEGNDVLEVLRQHAETMAPDLKNNCNQFIPDELDRLVAAMLEKDRKSRPQQMKEVLHSLRDIQNQVLEKEKTDRLKALLPEKQKEEAAQRKPLPTFAKIWVIVLIAILMFSFVGFISKKFGFQPSVSDSGKPLDKYVVPLRMNQAKEDDQEIFTIETGKLLEGPRGLMAMSSKSDSLDDDELKRLTMYGRDLKAINLSHSGITGSGLKHLRQLDVRILDLAKTQLSTVGYENLSKLVNLQRLSLLGCPVTDDQLKLLSNLDKLEYLDLSGCDQITDEAFKTLAAFPSLRILHVAKTPISDRALANLASSKTLDDLDFSGTDISDRGIEYLGTGKLHSLDLDGCKNISNRTLELIPRKFPHLRRLMISYTAIGPDKLDQVQKIPGLTTLDIKGYPVSSKMWKAIKEMKNIGYLYLQDDSISDADLPNLYDHEKLLDLFIYGGDGLTTDGLDKLRKHLRPKASLMNNKGYAPKTGEYNDLEGLWMESTSD